MMRLAIWGLPVLAACLAACGAASGTADPGPLGADSGTGFDASTPSPSPSVDAGPADLPDASPPPNEPKVDLEIVFVHGVTQFDDDRKVAHEQLVDLEKAVTAGIAARGDTNLVVSTTRVNIYTDDKGELISPRIDDLDDGTGVATATAWRAQLIKKTNAVFPDGKHIVYVGHSTGGRVVAEVGASEEMRDRVVGVVTIHGMIDALDSKKYNLVGPTSYIAACKAIKADGWCEYSGKISALSALDWLARERHVLALVGASSCSPSFWEGVNDQALPLQAQASPWSPGITLAPKAGSTYGPAHGTFYGEFCHPAIVGGDKHEEAVSKATAAIVTWLFDAAPRVVPSSNHPDVPYDVQGLDAEVFSPSIDFAGPCPEGRHGADNVDIAGLCRHPGKDDGDDHPFDDKSNTIDLTKGPTCNATVRVEHHHAGQSHAMSAWVKRYSLPTGGGVLSTLH